MDFPFKGDEAALWSMERSDLITIVTQQGRPSSIRPGKPLFRTVFERLANGNSFLIKFKQRLIIFRSSLRCNTRSAFQ